MANQEGIGRLFVLAQKAADVEKKARSFQVDAKGGKTDELLREALSLIMELGQVVVSLVGEVDGRNYDTLDAP